MRQQGLKSQCETTQVREYGTGAALLGYTKLYGQVPGGQAELLRVPQAQYGPIKVPEGPPDDRFVYLSDVLPTAWQAVEYADVPEADLLVLGLGPIGEMCSRIASSGVERVLGIDLVPERLERARGHGVETIELGHRTWRLWCETDRRPRARLGDRRGRHGGARVADRSLAHRLAGFLPDPIGQKLTQTAGIDRLAALHSRSSWSARRHDLPVRCLRRRGQPDAAHAAVRQAGDPPHGPGQRPALGRRHPAAGRRRRRSARSRGVRTHRLPLADARRAYEIFQKKEDGAFKVLLQP